MKVSELVNMLDRDTLVALVEDDDYLAWKASAFAYMPDKGAPDGVVTGIRVLAPPKTLVVYFA